MIIRIAFCCFLIGGVFVLGLQHFAYTIRMSAESAATELQITSQENTGVVVVTGSDGRITAGFMVLLEFDAKRMLISGTGAGVSKADILRHIERNTDFEAGVLKQRLECCVDLGREAQNTRGNAQETIEWAQANGVDEIILVTSDFHMPRALIEFRSLLPDHMIHAYPITTTGLARNKAGQTEWWQSHTRVLTIAREYSKYLFSLMRW